MDGMPRVKTFELLERRKVRIHFTGGTSREVDLLPLLRGPVFDAIREDDKAFRAVHVDDRLGTLVWENGADMDPDVLYGSHPPAWMDVGVVKEEGRSLLP